MKEPIAIIGIGCRFPGDIDDTESFWQLLVNEVDAISQMPAGRFDSSRYYDSTPAMAGKIITREGGFLDAIDHFDADFFKVSGYEASNVDPQQRLLLEVAWEALETAGLVPARLAGSKTGVFVGMWTSDYEALAQSSSDNIDLYITTGVGRYSASGRLSYTFDFRGPSMTLDTACSSSLVAIHLACQSLRNGESDLVLACGANLIITPPISIGYSRSGMLSPDGRCKFGDKSANGYVRSEGIGVIVLKRLSDALRDGDPIRAVIRGSGVNNDGQTGRSLVAPGIGGQTEVLKAAYQDAEVLPGEVGYVETHGTGTPIGDPVELKALGTILREGRSVDDPCWIGSVKTNIGHTEAASGMAGLIKAVLCLEHGEIPASLHFHEPNPNIPWAELPLKLVSQRVSWASSKPRYAGINSFGVTGTNAHVVLEAAPERDASALDKANHAEEPLILPLSAHKPDAVAELIKKYRTLLDNEPVNLKDVVYTTAIRRTHHAYRAAFVGHSASELAEQMASWSSASTIYSSRKVAFVFPGQGGQWLGMGRQLMQAEPVFRTMIERCEQAMQPYVHFQLTALLAGSEADFSLDDIGMIQPAIFAVQVGLAELWRAKGIEPDAVIGHSMGEVAAAYTAGVLSLEDAASIICMRSQLMRRVSGLGAMAVVELSLSEAQNALTGYEHQLSVAVNNAPRSVVISGDVNALEIILKRLQAQDVFCRRVKVDVAAHSPHMDALRPELMASLANIQPKPETTRLYSTVMGAAQTGAEFDAAYRGSNLRKPVLFAAAVQQALNDGYNTFIELGPHPLLLPAIERGLQDYGLEAETLEDIVLVESMRRDEDQLVVMAEAVAKLYAANYDVKWQRFYSAGQVVPLPSFPWQRERYWVDVEPAILIPKSVQPAVAKPWREWLYEPKWEQIESPVPEVANGTWLIFADHGEIGDSLTHYMLNHGHKVIVVRWGKDTIVNGQTEITIDAAKMADFHLLMPHLPEQLGGIVYLWGVELPAGMEMGVQALEAGQQQILGGLLHLTQSLIEARRAVPIWIVTQGAQSVGQERAELSPAQATLWGFSRVIREEQPDLWGGLLDLDPKTSENAVHAICNELGATDGEDQIAYRAGLRYALRLVRSEWPQSTQPYHFRPDGTYLITGGLGDIGSRLSKWMVEQGARRLILMGRTELPPRSQWRDTPADSNLGQKISIVRQLESLGASVHLAAIDAADEANLRAYLETFEHEGWPPIIGVIHAAGLLDVRLLQQMDWETMYYALRPKVVGGWLLHNLLPNVEMFINFSSINSLLGLPGQGNYAAANAFLDSMAAFRKAQGQHSLNINWSVWEGMGYAASAAGAESSSQLASQGIQGFPAEQGVQVVGEAMSLQIAELIVVPADRQQYQQARSARQYPMLKHLLQESPLRGVEQQPGMMLQVVERLFATDAKLRLSLLSDHLLQVISQLLRISPTRIKREVPLGNYGMSSLIGMELRNRSGARPRLDAFGDTGLELSNCRIYGSVPGAENGAGSRRDGYS